MYEIWLHITMHTSYIVSHKERNVVKYFSIINYRYWPCFILLFVLTFLNLTKKDDIHTFSFHSAVCNCCSVKVELIRAK